MNRRLEQSAVLVFSLFFLPLTARSQESRPAEQGEPDRQAKPESLSLRAARRIILSSLLGKGGKDDDAVKKNTDATRLLFVAGPAGTAYLGSLHRSSKALAAKFGNAEEGDRGTVEGMDKAVQLLEASLGKGEAAVQARESLFELGDKAAPVFHAFHKRLTKLHQNWISDKIREGLRSGAIFAGQYDELKLLGDDVQAMMFVMLDPEERDYAAGLEAGLLRALRDVVARLTKKQKDYLVSIADDDFEEDVIRDLSIYLLADTGDKARFLKKVEVFKALTDKEDESDKLEGYKGLSDVYYLGRIYKKAADAWRSYLKLREDDSDDDLASLRYNACCSMALAGELDQAFELLELAIKTKSFTNADRLLIIDHDINPLRKDDRFLALLEKYKKTFVIETLEKNKAKAKKKQAGGGKQN